ncbi:MAG: glycoside hydrolase family 5 protein [Rhizobacter sp.]|nr:glycoside hydrolase family 5 protein [Rhizobacter sp.]
MRPLLRLFTLALACTAFDAAACSFDQAPAARAESCNRLLARSINFGNMLDHAREGMAGPALRDEFVALAAEAGFTAIRLPVRWDAQAGYKPPYAIAPEFFERVDGVVQLAQRHGLALVLDMHHYTGMMSEPETERPRFLALWRQVAEHYRDAPATVLFEVLNEPHQDLTQPRWNEALAAVLPVIRASNPQRTLIVGGAQWNSRTMLDTLALPDDDLNLIATFHYYEPMEVTHQGAEWVSGAGAWLGTTWRPEGAQLRQLEQAFDGVADWARRTRRPVYLGEFGAYSRADDATRLAWTRAVREQAERHGFSWAYWELAAGFGVLEPRSLQWRRPLLQTLLPDSPALR